MKVQTGIDEKGRREVADGLNRLLADTYTLYVKTQGFHWNVTGSLFKSLHEMFEEQYSELHAMIDPLAERVRALGYPAMGSIAEYVKVTTINDSGQVPSAKDMLRQLLEDRESMARTTRHLIEVADGAGDQSTTDMLTGWLEQHEKTAWMLRSQLAE